MAADGVLGTIPAARVEQMDRDVRGGDMADAAWYEAMAKAIKRRDHALSMIERWKNELSDIEHEIERLRTDEEKEPQP